MTHQKILPHNSKDKNQYEVDNSKNGHRYVVLRLSYEDTKEIMEHRLA